VVHCSGLSSAGLGDELEGGLTGRESLELFRKLVLEDEALQERLRVETNEEAFITQVVRLGNDRGHHFTADEVDAVLRDARRAALLRWV
jgi:hypothetical protein